MMGVIGIVMLVGIAVNNSIILVDRINQLKQSGAEQYPADPNRRLPRRS